MSQPSERETNANPGKHDQQGGQGSGGRQKQQQNQQDPRSMRAPDRNDQAVQEKVPDGNRERNDGDTRRQIDVERE